MLPSLDTSARRRPTITTLGAVTLVLAVLAFLTPFSPVEVPTTRVGFLLALAAGIEVLHAQRRATAQARRRATTGAILSMTIALFLINAPFVAAQALRVVVAVWFGVDAVRYAIGAVRGKDTSPRSVTILAALGNAAVTVLLLFARGWVLTWVVALAGALRIFGISWNIMAAEVYTTADADETVVGQLGLSDRSEATALAAEVETNEKTRGPIDNGWTLAFIATLFAIHIGRMSTDLTILGLVSPAVAVLGDMLIAVLVTLLVINPLHLLWRGPTRWIERRVWRWRLRDPESPRARRLEHLADAWLRRRLRFAIRLREARYSIPAALNQGLQSGLPFAAIIAATVPVWGMSWYFDTENWAAGMWNSWAESRTDTWRESMARSVLAGEGGRPTATSFAVAPDGIAAGDFSFIVIGDPGEGDASQHVLRDQLLSVANRPDVRFVVVSSDVVYPTGAMKDYEAKFWLPFKGVTRPVYAIPGNHDWYDALEGFAATFLQADAARASIRARAEADLRVTSTTDERIEDLIGQAERLRQMYGVPTGFQRAPFFEVQTDRFALLSIDTGILRTIDPVQQEWLEGALTRSAGKMTMAVLGHPFFAGGHDTAAGDPEFEHLKQRLADAGVAIVMAGDTHDLEYYSDTGRSPAVHYFVNGGGGAYMSFGTSLAWPGRPPTTDWAYYPNHDAVTEKIHVRTPWWKRPAWWWTRQFGAWPFTAEWLSAAFDYNVAPFFQSFLEVSVERSANRVRIIPYGVHGRLTWGDFASSSVLRASASDGDFVEWVVPMTR
jgi:uncharacterized membrane protein HdeD (DUF308 family)/3',5'-cyclic AMP phosphodiesterase CpdA